MIADHGSTWTVWVGVGASVVALAPAGARWLRVAQREHYLPGSVSRFAGRWWRSEPGNVALAVVAVVGLVLSVHWPVVAVVPAAVVVLGPLRLSIRGRTSPLARTRRLRWLALVWIVLQAVVVAVGIVVHDAAVVAALGALAVPFLVDLACVVMAPVERRLLRPFVVAATARLRRVHPTVVAVTGSYGKTSVKNHIAYLVAGSRTILATPASFNNRAGLARAINEHLTEGTDVFVAEMGTYGPGEIAELCSWCPPDIAVLTAIGPVHLERFGSLDAIVTAKSEITTTASCVVLNIDDERLAGLADRLAAGPDPKLVRRCSAVDPRADVCVMRREDTFAVFVDGEELASEVPAPVGIQATNVACAVAVALQLGVPASSAIERVASIPSVPNRLTPGRSASGVLVLDDTFNANPAGTRAALAALAAIGTRRRVLVTPGMVELGPVQRQENRAFAEAAARVVTDLVVVGRTNRRSLLAGADPVVPVVVGTREEAVAWVRTHLGIDDAVLYVNDLPDQYP